MTSCFDTEWLWWLRSKGRDCLLVNLFPLVATEHGRDGIFLLMSTWSCGRFEIDRTVGDHLDAWYATKREHRERKHEHMLKQERHGRPVNRLTHSMIREIQQTYAEHGGTKKEFALKLGMKYSTIIRILSGKIAGWPDD